mmetsp:Transcript_4118/g.15530  ORF Transcript_4118/g.15530 Transcript_4118/m.15530 type:complete len:85 (-) Transcript_4118:3274-3528(-)
MRCSIFPPPPPPPPTTCTNKSIEISFFRPSRLLDEDHRRFASEETNEQQVFHQERFIGDYPTKNEVRASIFIVSPRKIPIPLGE